MNKKAIRNFSVRVSSPESDQSTYKLFHKRSRLQECTYLWTTNRIFGSH